MARKTPAAKKSVPASDLFFKPSAKKRSDGGFAAGTDEQATRLERQLILLRQEYTRLCEENARLKEAASLAPYGYCELDRRGMVLDANDVAMRLLRSDGATLQGIAFVSFLPERFHQKFLSFLNHAFRSDITQSIELPILPAIDNEYPLKLDCRSVERASGRVLCCIVHEPSDDASSAHAERMHEKHFRMIAEDSSDWTMWIGEDGALIWVNKGVELLTGYAPGECYAMPDFPYSLVAEEDRQVIAEVLSEGLRGGEESGIEFRYRHKGGHQAWGRLEYHPMYDASGQTLGFWATVRAIAQEKELEEELESARRMIDTAARQRTAVLQQKYAALNEEVTALNAVLDAVTRDQFYPDTPLTSGDPSSVCAEPGGRKHPLRLSKQFFEQVINALGDLVFVKDKDHRYILANDSFVAFTGIPRDRIIGRCDHDLFKPDEADMFAASENAVLEQRREFLVEELLTRHDGQQRRVLVKKDINFDEAGNPFIISVLRDVTEIRNVEDDVRAALARERELNELKSRFVTMVSHEYKTPLTAILSSAELLELFRKSWNDEKVDLHLQKIKRAVETMTEMLSDALFLNKIETGRVQITPNTFELVSFCIMIADEVQACATQQNTIETSSSVTHALVSTDNKLLRYILTNLLSNAVKYSHPATSIQFETVLTETAATFRVRNRGIGIPLENQGSLFEPFFRAPNTGTIQGSGLGLSIVKRCVDSLQGTVSFESIPNEATTFSVTIPISVIEYQTGIARAVPKQFFTS